MLIIRRVNCINMTSGICPSKPAYHMVTNTDHSAVSRLRYTRDRIDTNDSPDDEHLVARNM